MPKRAKNHPVAYTDYEREIAEAMGTRLHTRRKELQLTQEQVRERMAAAHILITRTQFSRIENGDSLLYATELIAIATALDMSYQWLLDGEAPVEPER